MTADALNGQALASSGLPPTRPVARRTVLTGLGAAGITPLLMTSPAIARPRKDRVLASRLRAPWGIAFLPNGDALVTERYTAKVHRISRRGGRTYVGRIAGVDDDAGEGGLLGCVASPTFRLDRQVFFYLTSGSDNRVVRYTYAGGRLSQRRTVIDSIQRGVRTHDGGRLAFGPDDKLYITTGDARDDSTAQDLGSLAGKILRIEADGSVPTDNPFTGSPVWSYGHRNVQGLDWDGRGVLWATEFGEQVRDELNKIRPGHDYGWPGVEGGDGPGGVHDPFVIWKPTGICSPSGVAIAKGRAWVGALAGRCMYSVVLRGSGKRTVRRHFTNTWGRIRTVQRAPDGSLWITTSNRDGRGSPRPGDDKVIRITV